MAQDSKRGSELVEVIKSDDVTDLFKEYGEIAIDSALESGTLESIPLLNTLVGIFKTVSSVHDRRFTEKLIRFISGFADLDDATRINMANRLNENDKFAGKAGDRLIEIIDRMESENKPEIAAAFLKAFAFEHIDFITLRRLMVALERIPSFEIDELDTFSKYDENNHHQISDEALLLSFVNAGLGKNNGGFEGGIILPTDLCAVFVRFKGFKPE
ncbi:TPA: hypothetical protein ACG0AS_002931 [Enterobacter hormaechei subsp. hoffmannii]|jgi:hypothetical protein|uniref:Uncharacterized protein n=12 Tax=Enterobacteriaceae TaxID=543 RepID=A0A6G6AQE4_KLUCR|nr:MULTISPECIES: hypothetical protein [Enterobacteriaceae]ASB76742.1 hypothetical protein AM429_23005 [Enterobacter cloacae complex sp.]EAA3611346.1 hypothetical protein [Salmonella enterica subsp. enterica serovar Mbandaka]EAB2319449.1 hypothetical protein [Salmonella enterica]EBS5432769.1 hypothetical protein [Salmonella enterica subsp. enterica serovar Alachua]EBV1651458.1 hypothetical protein [Salmonella enterica subsp. enterica serovar Bareilly]EBY2790077.1 hypothetical protein [Salmonel